MRSPIKYLLAVLVAALLAITTAEAQTITYITANGTTKATWTINGPGTGGVAISPTGIASGTVLTGTSGTAASFRTPNLTRVANIAALSALPSATLPDGAVAFVSTVGAYWTLQSSSALTTDGITIVSAAGGGRWLRSLSGIQEAAQAQTAWNVDPSAGDDENTGLTSGTAVKHKAEIVRRWGTNAPTLSVVVTITYLSSDTDGTDPGNFNPLFVGGQLVQVATLPAASFTGTLLAVTVKNRASNVALSSTFTVATGAVAPNMLLINSTRANSRAIVQKDLGGGNFRLSQPLAVYVDGTFPSGTENDAWANGDTVQGFVPLTVNLVQLGGKLDPFIATFAPNHVIKQIKIASPGGTGLFFTDPNAFPALIDSIVASAWTNGPPAQFNNFTQFQGVACTSTLVADSLRVLGGILGSSGLHNSIITSDPILSVAGPIQLDSCNVSGGTFVDTGTTLRGTGSDIYTADAIFYGPGTYNQFQGVANYTATAVATFPLAGGLQLAGVTTGYSNATTAGVTTVHGGISLTPANLDAVAGAAGFGGYAYGSGATFSKAGVQP